MSKAKRLLANALWTYGAQLITVVVQFGYAALTSRILGGESFGLYAVALSVSALVTLLANGGLGQAAGRMTSIEIPRVRSLSMYGWLLGTAGAIILFFSAPFWANLWGVPEAVAPIRWMTLSAFVSPWLGLAAGLMRRQGQFKKFAMITVAFSILGMALGAIAVATWASPSALLVSPISSQIGIAIACGYYNATLLFGSVSLRHAKEDIGYSWKITVASLISYLNGNIGKWATSVGIGFAALGQWNRADVITTVPFQQLQNAMIGAVYPEFRHDRESGKRARRAWADLLGIVAWIVLPAATALAMLMPRVVPILFGPGWLLAAQLTVFLSLIGGIQAVVVMLGGAVEALGRFKWIWATQGLLLIVYASAAFMAIHWNDLTLIFWGMLIALAVQHILQVCLCSRAGYLDVRLLSHHYGQVAVGCTGVAVIIWFHIGLVHMWETTPVLPYLLILMDLIVVATLIKGRHRLPPIRIASAYGWLGGSASQTRLRG